ncbi:MAG TPA: MarR family transcriptional regulator [Treponemataceae bacterium]|jgi:DNA-binding MarR family transcriptional regulator|nr:MarR family transcriptional regulator [Treponemataceae bacterium]
MSSPDLLLGNQLCFLVYRLDRAIGSVYRPLLSAIGLTYPQYLAMLVMWERGSVGIGELCALLDLETGTVSPLMKRLESLGLVTRERDPGDERSVRARLTDKGRRLERKAASIPGNVASCLLGGKGEYASIRSFLEGLIQRVERST